MTNQITPERLKRLAESLGKKIHGFATQDFRGLCKKGELIVSDPAKIELQYVYQPHKDWNQCGEVLEELYKDARVLEVSLQYDPQHNEHFCDITLIEGGYYRGISKSGPKEAIVLAAFEFIESK